MTKPFAETSEETVDEILEMALKLHPRHMDNQTDLMRLKALAEEIVKLREHTQELFTNLHFFLDGGTVTKEARDKWHSGEITTEQCILGEW